jgi:hypothetical protein
VSGGTRARILAWGRVVDGRGDLAGVDAAWSELVRRGARTVDLTIDPLHAGWDAPIEPNHFRSGCAPLEALAHADELIRDGRAEAVRIRGEDLLRTRYANDKAARQRLMAIYGDACPLPEAYTLLARAFMRLHGLNDARFRRLAERLFENYTLTAKRDRAYTPPRSEAFSEVTDLFRAVDCANPVVDFAGAVVLGRDDLRESRGPRVLGVGVGRTAGDGPDHADEIARYEHLAAACRDAGARAGVDFSAEFRAGGAVLEAYTCFPVAPLGFLLASGIAPNIDAIDDVLTQREITITGGMNLARAPWNNPALNALIAACERLAASGGAALAGVHGNGGLGYRQGFAIIGR